MLESAQKFKKIDSDYYVISHQLFRVAYIILRNLQNTTLQIFPTKISYGNPVNDYQQKKEK